MVRQRIFVKQFESPESFLYTQYDAHVAKVEEILNRRSATSPLTQLSPNAIADGDIVAIFYRPWQKYIISRIVSNPNAPHFNFAWLINYGFQVKLRNDPVYTVPEDVDSSSCYVKKGSIRNISISDEKKWSTEKCLQILNILKNASKIYFINFYINTTDHHWGDLKVCMRDGKMIDVGEYLVKEGHAVKICDHHATDRAINQTEELSVSIRPVHDNPDDLQEQEECFQTNKGFGFSALPDFQKENACCHTEVRQCPAGFDITRLNKYNDPNHWHIRKSTKAIDELPKSKGKSLKKRKKQNIVMARTNEESHIVAGILNPVDVNASSPTPHKPKVSDFKISSPNRCFGHGHGRAMMSLGNTNEKPENSLTSMGVNVQPGSGRGAVLAALRELSKSQAKENIVVSKREVEALMENAEELDPQLDDTFLGSLVVAHSEVLLKQCNSLGEAGFGTLLTDVMRSNDRFVKLYRTQSYAWPHVVCGNSLVVVDAPKSGKTWCYLPTICDLIASHARDRQIRQRNGPTAIVFVATQARVELTASKCEHLLQQCSNKKWQTVLAYDDERNASKMSMKLINGCGVFITTANLFLNLVKAHKQLDCMFDVDVLKHIVLDDVDEMLVYSKERCMKLIATLMRLFKSGDQLNASLTVTSKHFIPGFMDRAMQLMRNPLLLIGDFLEAAVYGKLKMTIKICEPQDKIECVVSQIAIMNKTDRKIAVVGRSIKDVQKLTAGLRNRGISTLDCTENAKRNPLQYQSEQQDVVFVYSDADLQQMQIKNAQVVINYGMSDTWEQFAKRFSLISDAIPNFVATNLGVGTGASLETIICLGKSEVAQNRPYFIEFFRHHDNKIIADHYMQQVKEPSTRDQMPLCTTLMDGGSCSDLMCKQRHKLIASDLELDATNAISCCEEISLHVYEVYSPIHVAALILRCKPKNEPWKKVPPTFIRVQMGLDIHYGNPNNCVHHSPQRVDDICVTKMQFHYTRVRLVSVPVCETDPTGRSCDVVAKLLDYGTHLLHLKSSDLFVCAEKFRKEPATAIDIRLTGLVANNDENHWSRAAIENATTWLKNKRSKDSIIHASIDCVMRETIFVKNIVIMDYLPTIKLYVYDVNVKEFLKKMGFAKDQAEISQIKQMIKLFKGQCKHAAIEGKQKQQLPADLANVVSCDVDVTSNEASQKGPTICQSTQQFVHNELNKPDLFNDMSASIVRPKNIENENVVANKIVEEQVAPCDKSNINCANEMEFNKFLTRLRRYQDIDDEAAVEVGYTLFGDIFDPKKTHQRGDTEKSVTVNAVNMEVSPETKNEQQPKVAVGAAGCLPPLVAHSKHPQITWYDTAGYVHLQIQADKTKDYDISCQPDIFIYGDKANNESCCLHLCGLIDTAHVEHELRGINVIVKMKKQNCGKWPRLLKKDGKQTPNWLKYNLDKYVEEQKQLNEAQQKLRLFYETEALKHVGDTTYDSSECNDDDCDDVLDDDCCELNVDDDDDD